jgi:hypothetical protein
VAKFESRGPSKIINERQKQRIDQLTLPSQNVIKNCHRLCERDGHSVFGNNFVEKIYIFAKL